MWKAGLAAAVCVPAALALTGSGAPAKAKAAASHRLNVVVILSDDERTDGIGVMKNVRTLLARHGVTFDDYHVTTSECAPSRASILSGQYSHHTGVVENYGLGTYTAFDTTANIAVSLQNGGYDTALIGKYLNDYAATGQNVIPPGWSDWEVMDSTPVEKYYNYDLNENGKLVHYGGKHADYSTTVLAGKAVSFIQKATKPFFLYFAPIAPHLPAVAPPGDSNKLADLPPLHEPDLNEKNISDKPWQALHRFVLSGGALKRDEKVRRRQLQSLLAVDQSVAQIVAALKARGILNNTVIVYTSDNGFFWGEHRLGGKVWPYEESTRVPLIVRTPWTAANGTVNHEPVLNIDLASTIGELTGVMPDLPQDGDSFAGMLHGKTIPWRTSYLLEYLGSDLSKKGGPPPYVAIHTDRYLYVEYENGWRELYDLQLDPWELHNRASDPAYAPVMSELNDQLQQLYAAAPHPPRAVWSDPAAGVPVSSVWPTTTTATTTTATTTTTGP